LVDEDEHRKLRKSNLLLALSGGLLLGLSFPPLPLSFLAYVAFVPILLLVEQVSTIGKLLRYSYAAFLLFNIVGLYWVGGFTHGRDPYLMTSGVALILVHPMFFWIPLLAYYAARKTLGLPAALILFPFLFTAFEYLHGLGEFAFPWLSIGYTQSYDLARIQIAEFVSVYGVSFLVFAFNALLFYISTEWLSHQVSLKSKKVIIPAIGLIAIIILPPLYGWFRIRSLQAQQHQTAVQVAVIQPNFDPFEKWGEGSRNKWESYRTQFDYYVDETKNIARASDSTSKPELIVYPETAIPFYLLLPQNRNFLNRLTHTVDSLNISVFTGLPYAVFEDSAHASPTATRIHGSEFFYEAFNSATLIQPRKEIDQIYKKMILVPFAERIPYAQYLSFLIEPLKWSVGISGWGKGMDTVVFILPTTHGNIPFSSMICYESIYPQFVREFASKGAQFLIVVTNDSWYGNTSGPYQHAACGVFRAIENRRWIVRCANGGISGFIGPDGSFHNRTAMFAQRTVSALIEARSEKSWYVRYGDLFSKTCVIISILSLIWTLFIFIRSKFNAATNH
jgi:apolipoprotein N-acyltransferase